MSIQSNFHFRIIGVITDNCKKTLKISIQAVGIQLNQDFSPAAGRDGRVKPDHFTASVIFDF
ncbi:MAG: hypothetical protein A2Y79_03705 [Deltaproteobacteria bacterium RBG_13_43_22]|nr:MAG: hypothetical protein A2Y79_03705 [Deltaproteobacteria bacterium RBG_13_43_22]